MNRNNVSEQRKKYLQFQVDMLNAKHKGVHTEQQIVEKLIALFQENNVYAKRAFEEAKQEFAPRSNIRNTFWDKDNVYLMRGDVARTSSKQTSNTDEHGMWRYDQGDIN